MASRPRKPTIASRVAELEAQVARMRQAIGLLCNTTVETQEQAIKIMELMERTPKKDSPRGKRGDY